MKKIAILLSGCGVFDGTEIQEAVLTMLYIDKAGAQYQCFAPDIEQHHTINHLSGEEMLNNRNVLIESARIARGNIKNLLELSPHEYDALVIPGGFGVAKNLSDFAFKQAQSSVLPSVKDSCYAFQNAHKPIAYICIAPAIIGHIHPQGTKATIGNDLDTANAAEQLGIEHIECGVTDIIFDEKNKVISTPAYMLASSINEAAIGIEKTIEKLIEVC